MGTKKIVGVASILFCVALLLIYTFGFIINPNKTANEQIIAKKDDLTANVSESSTIITTNKTENTIQTNKNPNVSQTPPTVAYTTTTRNTGRTTRAS